MVVRDEGVSASKMSCIVSGVALQVLPLFVNGKAREESKFGHPHMNAT